MACSAADKENKEPPPPPWFKNKKALSNVLYAMRRHSLSTTQERVPLSVFTKPTTKLQDLSTLTNLVSDRTSLLSDGILLKILSKIPESQRTANFLVSKRWLNLQGRLVRSLKLLDWGFLVSGRLLLRFPNLVRVDLVGGCLVSPRNNSGISVSHKTVSFRVGSDNVVDGSSSNKDWVFNEDSVLNADEVDRGLRVLADGFPNLRKLAVINAGETGLLIVAEECPTLQELELRMCNDRVLRGIAACKNLQILRLGGTVDGLYVSLVSDIGLSIVAKGCKRLVKLELSGCKGSYEGIRAIGQCCVMLEELTLCNHEMEDGWLLALSYFENLKSLRFSSCTRIDGGFRLDEHLGFCPAVESLFLDKCRIRDKTSLRALFLVCRNVKELVLKNCWGLTDDMFTTASVLRTIRMLSLEGCSLLTSQGLECVIIPWNELKSLKVKSCNNIKDDEVVSDVFSSLKNLKWEPDRKTRVSISLDGTGMGKRGDKFFNKARDWKSLSGS
ncbi:hypothetical protein ACP275_06G117800 [Erythranthe tilingii]